MAQFYLIPTWFFGFGLILQLLFAFVTLAIALYSFKIYKLCMERKCNLFGWAFLSLAFSYFAWAFVSWYVPNQLSSQDGVFSLTDFTGLIAAGVYTQVLFFILGLVTLTYITLGIRSQRTFTLLASLSFIVLIFSAQKIIAFYFVASLLLFFVVIHYVLEHLRGKRSTLILLAFIFLFLGSIDFTFSAVNQIHYVGGHLLFFIGYAFMLINFVLMLKSTYSERRRSKHGKKKKQT